MKTAHQQDAIVAAAALVKALANSREGNTSDAFRIRSELEAVLYYAGIKAVTIERTANDDDE